MAETKLNTEKTFQFMMQENEKFYENIEKHFGSIEKTISAFLIIIASLVSVNGFMIKNAKGFSIFDLNSFEIITSCFISIIGIGTFIKVVEHRLLIHAYVKALNLNRLWFTKHSECEELKKYLFWKPTVKNPAYYKKSGHPFWELLLLAIINAPFPAMFIINLLKKLNFKSEYSNIINGAFFVIVIVFYTFLMMNLYKLRAQHSEKDLQKEITDGKINDE